MNAATANEARPRSGWRWLQFRLRTLCVLLVVSSLFFAYLVSVRNEARAHAAALDVLSEFSGSIVVSELQDELVTAVWTRRMLGYETKPKRVESICLEGISDAQMVHIGALSELRVLRLGGAMLTDNGVRAIGGLKQLENLNLSGTQITDQGLDALAGLENLRFLRLRDTAVSDQGLRKLHGLKKLESVSLLRTDVTDEGLHELMLAIPGCQARR
jgi:hypothetical protein